MKKNLFVILILLPLLTSCAALSELTKIPTSISQNITIPMIPVAGGSLIPITTPDIKVNVDSILSAAGMSKDLIQTVKLSTMDFTLTSPTGTGKDLSFLSNVTVALVYSGTPTTIASTTSAVSAGTTVLPFTVQDVDLKPYFSTFKLKVSGNTTKATTADYFVTIHMKFIVDLNILGL